MMRVEAKNESNEEVFYHPIISPLLYSVTNRVEGTRQFIFPVINHEVHSFRDIDIETVTTSLSIELNWAIRLSASPHMTTVRDTSLSTRHGWLMKGDSELRAMD